MTSDEFIEALIRCVHDSSVSDVVDALRAPSGRRPPPRQVELSQWFNELSGADQTRLVQVVEQAVHAAPFGVLCVLDGVRAIDGTPEKSELQLLAFSGGNCDRLNSPNGELLHDIYQGLVYERVFGRKA